MLFCCEKLQYVFVVLIEIIDIVLTRNFTYQCKRSGNGHGIFLRPNAVGLFYMLI
jgi:hypothetical protein